jgi:hypothetical protein
VELRQGRSASGSCRSTNAPDAVDDIIPLKVN